MYTRSSICHENDMWWSLRAGHERFIEALNNFLPLKAKETARSYRTIARDWLAYCARHRLDPSRPTIDATLRYAEEVMQRKGSTPRVGDQQGICKQTAVRSATILRAILRPEGEAFRVVIERLRRSAKSGEKRPTEAITKEQVLQLINSPWPGQRDGLRDRAFLALLFGGGLRLGEAVACGLLIFSNARMPPSSVYDRLNRVAIRSRSCRSGREIGFRLICEID